MKSMRAWMSSKFGRIRPRTKELAALERMKNKSHRLIMKTIKNIIMCSFKSSGDIQKKEGGPDSCFG